MYQLQFQSILSHIVPQRGRFDYQHLTMVGEGEGGVGSLGNSWLIYNHKDSYSYADKIEKRSDNSPHTWSYYLLPVEKVSHSQLGLGDLLPHTLCDFHVYVLFSA